MKGNGGGWAGKGMSKKGRVRTGSHGGRGSCCVACRRWWGGCASGGWGWGGRLGKSSMGVSTFDTQTYQEAAACVGAMGAMKALPQYCSSALDYVYVAERIPLWMPMFHVLHGSTLVPIFQTQRGYKGILLSLSQAGRQSFSTEACELVSGMRVSTRCKWEAAVQRAAS